VEIDFTLRGAVTAPSYLQHAKLGTLPQELLETLKRKAYDDRVLHNTSMPARKNVSFVPLACAYPTNQWGKAFEDLIKEVTMEVNASLNHDEHTHVGQFDRARLQVHWLRGRLAATAARFNYQAITDWERKVVSVLDKTVQVDARLVTNDAVRSFPSELQVSVRCRLWIW
jgi:hypothetical protein